MTRDLDTIVGDVLTASPLPATVEALDAGARRLLSWRAERAGMTPAAYLAQARAEQADSTATSSLVADVVAATRRL